MFSRKLKLFGYFVVVVWELWKGNKKKLNDFRIKISTIGNLVPFSAWVVYIEQVLLKLDSQCRRLLLLEYRTIYPLYQLNWKLCVCNSQTIFEYSHDKLEIFDGILKKKIRKFNEKIWKIENNKKNWKSEFILIKEKKLKKRLNFVKTLKQILKNLVFMENFGMRHNVGMNTMMIKKENKCNIRLCFPIETFE